ncbi:MAG TPA: dual specificity protein phosphatase family protein [Accumulibacter sp.]|nr:dual specificity protein phosphatase family protein [Accumulibacter sp.]
MQKQYHELIPGRIFLGGAGDMQQLAEVEGIEVVVDLREEATGCAASDSALVWRRVPIGDESEHPQTALFNEAIQAVVAAYRDGKKVAFHCGGGKGRTGAVATGVLLELGLCDTLDEAEAAAKAIRPVIRIRPDQRQALEQLYPQARSGRD